LKRQKYINDKEVSNVSKKCIKKDNAKEAYINHREVVEKYKSGSCAVVVVG
jgi:hypothetical protein